MRIANHIDVKTALHNTKRLDCAIPVQQFFEESSWQALTKQLDKKKNRGARCLDVPTADVAGWIARLEARAAVIFLVKRDPERELARHAIGVRLTTQ